VKQDGGVHARQVRPENQHYIPKFLLRLFGHGQGHGHVWTCDKATGVITRRSVNRTASGPDFYAINYPDARDTASLERLFGALESAAAPFLKALGVLPPGRHEMGAAERDLLAGWLALSYARVPGTIGTTLAMAKFAVAVQTDMLLRNPAEYRRRARAQGTSKTDAELEAERTRDLREHSERILVVEPAPETGLTALGHAVEDIKPVLGQMRWDIARRDRFPWFILGDQPVTIARPPDLSRHLGAGFATPGVEVYAPISPGALLVGSHEPHDGSITVVAPDQRLLRPSLSPDWALRPNLTAFTHAQREVFGRSQADLEAARLALAPEDRTWVPQMSVSGIPQEWLPYVPAGMVVNDLNAPWRREAAEDGRPGIEGEHRAGDEGGVP
jgi:hypothetical protein